MDDFRLKLDLKAPPDRVYEAIASRNGPAQWWTAFAEIDPNEDGRAHFPFPDAGFHATFEIQTLDPPHLVEWRCIDSSHAASSGWSDLTEWNDTTVRFEIEPNGDGTSLVFTHVGLIPRLECNETCRSSWKFYLEESLRGYVEDGEGKPYRGDSGG